MFTMSWLPCWLFILGVLNMMSWMPAFFEASEPVIVIGISSTCYFILFFVNVSYLCCLLTMMSWIPASFEVGKAAIVIGIHQHVIWFHFLLLFPTCVIYWIWWVEPLHLLKLMKLYYCYWEFIIFFPLL